MELTMNDFTSYFRRIDYLREVRQIAFINNQFQENDETRRIEKEINREERRFNKKVTEALQLSI